MNPDNWAVSIEHLDAEAARSYGRADVEGQLGLVVRYNGRFVRVDAARDEIPQAISMEEAARAVAEDYGVRLLPLQREGEADA